MWFCVCSCMQKNKDRPWQQVNLEPDSQYLSKYCSFFLPWISAIILITVRSWWYVHIWKGWKNHCVLPPVRWRAWISDFAEFQLSEEKSTAIFDPANSGLPILRPLLKVGERECIWRQKRWVHCIVPFSRCTCMKSHLFHAIYPKQIFSRFSCKHATINCESGGNRQLGTKVRELSAYQQ